MKLPVLILSPFYWGPPRTQGLRSVPALFGGHEKVGVRSPLPIWSPFYWGPPRRHGLRSYSALFGGPREGRYDIAHSDFVPFLFRTPENARVT